jgi:acetyl-CoA synthetase (ADP-forming)
VGRKILLENEAKNVCIEYGISTTRFKLTTSIDEAVNYSEQIGYPVVLKIVSPNIIHKSDVGGVILNIKNQKEVKKAYEKIINNILKLENKVEIIGVLVQEMIPLSTEIIVGSVKDPQFGPTLMFGLGGIFVEILKDVTFRIAPITEHDALKMISEIKAYPLLRGYRNTPPIDVDIIVKILLKTSQLVMDHQEIQELDLNPIMIYKNEAKVVDARIILE